MDFLRTFLLFFGVLRALVGVRQRGDCRGCCLGGGEKQSPKSRRMGRSGNKRGLFADRGGSR